MWQFPKNVNIELPYDPAIPLLGIDPKELKTDAKTSTCTQMFIAALFPIAKRQKQPQCPSADDWMNQCGLSIQRNVIHP